jgi:hypothetical protein
MRKKIGLLFLVVAFLASIGNKVNAATDNDVTAVTLGVGSAIAIDCTNAVTMNSITSTGQSTLDGANEATCNIDTNNSGGYALTWQASAASLTSGSDTIGAYTPGTADTTEVWSVAGTDSEWGARLKHTGSTDQNDSEWGATDTYAAGEWLNVSSTAAREIVRRTSETSVAGSDEIIQFGAEIGSSKFQPTGNYTVNVTFTATTL